jgi:hypothetical protein
MKYVKTFETFEVPEPYKVISDHIDQYNIYAGTARDAWRGINGLNQYTWNLKPIWIQPNDPKIKNLYAHSKRDVKRYMKEYKNGSGFPPVVLVDTGKEYLFLDGAHRLEAAVNLNVPIKAYIGKPKKK